MKNPEWLETFIEEEGFTPIAEDQYECAGGHVWHIDEIIDLWHQERCWKVFLDKNFWHEKCSPPRANFPRATY